MAGNTGKFLALYLSTREMRTEPAAQQVILDFIGGRGFGIDYL